MRAYHIGNVVKYFRKTIGVVLLVDISYIIALLPLALCITHIVNIEAKRLCKVIKSIQLQLILHVATHSQNKIKKAQMQSEKTEIHLSLQ